MHHFFVSPEQIGEKTVTITGGDVNHIKNVLRMAVGEQFTVSSGEERSYRCEILSVEEDRVEAGIMWIEEADTELPSKIYLFQGLPKSGKMEFIIQKAVDELEGSIVPHDTVIDELKELAKKQNIDDENLAVAMAVYMLGFGSYKGF